MSRGKRLLPGFLLLAVLILPSQAYSACSEGFIDMINDINWTGVYPIRMGAQTISPSFPEDESLVNEILCKCKDGDEERIGITIGYRSPARMIDVVKDPFCLNALGIELQDHDIWGGGGTLGQQGKGGDNSYFGQAHLYIFPVWYILEIMTDFVCESPGSLDIGYLTEFDVLWNDDMMANILSPESMLFQNPIAHFSCIPDSIASSAGYPMDTLFWCNGAWGGVYPIGGTSQASTQIEASAGVASKFLYKLHRELIAWGTKGEAALCGKYVLPVWQKSQYRFQILKPNAGDMLFPVGRTSLIWGMGKSSVSPDPDQAADNYTYLLWRYRDCCAF